MLDKIDFVFPYVDNSDIFWQDKYFNTVGKMPEVNSTRFRKSIDIKYLFRSIEQNTDFIRSIVMIVDDYSQVPDWLDKSKVRIVRHADFIPASKLPTFNSDTIEMYLWNIPDLTDRFLYGNDDTFFNSLCHIDDFFSNNKIKVLFREKQLSNTVFLRLCRRQFCFVRDRLGKTFKSNIYLQPMHTISPMRTDLLKQCHDIFANDMDNSCTQLRDCDKNFNQYIYTTYAYFNDLVEKPTAEFKYYDMSVDNYASAVYDILHQTCQTICLNDTPRTSHKAISKVSEALEARYNAKSIFER